MAKFAREIQMTRAEKSQKGVITSGQASRSFRKASVFEQGLSGFVGTRVSTQQVESSSAIPTAATALG